MSFNQADLNVKGNFRHQWITIRHGITVCKRWSRISKLPGSFLFLDRYNKLKQRQSTKYCGHTVSYVLAIRYLQVCGTDFKRFVVRVDVWV